MLKLPPPARLLHDPNVVVDQAHELEMVVPRVCAHEHLPCPIVVPGLPQAHGRVLDQAQDHKCVEHVWVAGLHKYVEQDHGQIQGLQ